MFELKSLVTLYKPAPHHSLAFHCTSHQEVSRNQPWKMLQTTFSAGAMKSLSPGSPPTPPLPEEGSGGPVLRWTIWTHLFLLLTKPVAFGRFV